MASNTSSISITKIAAATIPDGVPASSEKRRKFAERVVGGSSPCPCYFGFSLIVLMQVCTSLTPCLSWYSLLFRLKRINQQAFQKLVELIAALQTSQSTLERARTYAVACGKGEVSAAARITTNGLQPPRVRGHNISRCTGFRLECCVDAIHQ